MAAKFVAILEDHAGRAAAMRRVLVRLLPEVNTVVFPSAREFIRFFDHYLTDVQLISLDHDLAWPVAKGGIAISGDPGTGRDVVEHLARFPCLCPVIVHTSNADARPGMLRVLNEARWVCAGVTPGAGETWIDTEWREQIEVFAARGLIF